MLDISEYCVFAGIVAAILALAFYVLAFAAVRVARGRATLATEPPGGGTATIEVEPPGGLAVFGTLTTWLALGFLTAALVFRWFATGHGPFANMYEFSIAFAWGALAVHVYFLGRYRQWTIGIVVLPVALALLLYATTNPSTAAPLVPALQNNLLLSVHVAVAVIAYGAFAVGFAAALLYVLQPDGRRWFLPKRELLDDLSYRATLIGFPFLTLTIVLGAVWAEVAWGRYWSWDPKESASLVTWIVCGAYLHARAARGWRGRRAALLLMLVFAATLFTYFGNYFFGGLHSYG
jgi:ABC-type transport system involved in cytochrome c biogenesis permease subunit